jgi:succinoglycan biosynthesis protein ExoA
VTDQPSVDVIVPAKDAGDSIRPALEAVTSQTYPLVGLVVVAASDPGTAAVARDCGAVVVDNPSGQTPTGLNLALAKTTGEMIARVDAHSVIPPGYIERAVATLLETDADCVGGMQVPMGDTFWEKAIAAAMASPFGAGDARYRIGGVAGPTDTVYLGVFRRATMTRHHGYDESFERNQDYELNHRIRAAGGVVWFDPALRVTYHPRGSLTELSKQYFQYGRWKRYFSRRHADSLRWRQLAAPLLVILLAVSTAVGFWWWPACSIPAGYLAGLVLVSLARLPRLGAPALGMGPALATMHLSWGVGFLSG